MTVYDCDRACCYTFTLCSARWVGWSGGFTTVATGFYCGAGGKEAKPLQGELGFESYSCANSKELNTPSSIVIAVPGKTFGCMAAFSRESCLQVLDRPLQAFNSSVYASSGVTVKLRFQKILSFLFEHALPLQCPTCHFARVFVVGSVANCIFYRLHRIAYALL